MELNELCRDLERLITIELYHPDLEEKTEYESHSSLTFRNATQPGHLRGGIRRP